MNLDEIEKSLQDLQNQLRSKPGPSASKPQIPQEYYHRIEKKPDPLEEKIDKYADLDGVIVTGRPPVKYDFVDREWIGKPGVMLERYTDERIAAIGRVVIPMLSSDFSREAAAAIFILAYHLKAPGSRFRAFIFNSDESLQVMTDERYSDYSDKGKVTCVITATGDPTREAAVYSYVAASLFRLFTKPASYYVKTWSQILNGFSRSYAEPMRVILPVPTEAAVENLKNWFSMNERAKVTLYRFLYMSNSDESHKGLKNFLYDNHLSNTGMHIVSIIVQLSDVLNCSLESIVTAIDAKHTKSQIKCLVHMLKLLTGNDENHKKNMWRYGRIFDQAFMSDLQTKSCPQLVYMLAEALRSEAPEKHSGILQIAQLAVVREDDKRKYEIVAQRLLAQLKHQNLEASSSTSSLPTLGP